MTFAQSDLFERPAPRVFSVREINDAVRRCLEENLGEVVIEGEISNAKLQTSGHWYFTLKDDAAQLAVVMFRSDAAELRFRPENGLTVRATGRLTVYAAQGRMQLVARALVPVGQGALELAFRQLKEKLEKEGLFDPARKKPLPRFPRRVALVTSPTGAAVRDMLATLAARWPLARVFVVPVAVQGETAPGDIVRALAFLGRVRAADVVLLGRGGGSLEDLWAFNDERVARAIAASPIPIVSGVGHEVDFTIADFVADKRAATPTAAAALAVPHRDEVKRLLAQHDARLGRALRRRLEVPRERLAALARSYGMRRLPLFIAELAQAVDERLEALELAARRRLEDGRRQLAGLETHLSALGPARVLERGYTYCVDATTGTVVARAAGTRPGQDLRLHFADGVRAAEIVGEGR